jgi:hypothetical protein
MQKCVSCGSVRDSEPRQQDRRIEIRMKTAVSDDLSCRKIQNHKVAMLRDNSARNVHGL